MSKKNNGGVLIAGMMVGGAIGTMLGILIAPRSGRETRRIIQKSAQAIPELVEDVSSSVQLQADRLSDSAKRNWDETLTRLKEAIAAGIEATQIEAQEIPPSREVMVESNSLEINKQE
ncbi:YtxH domain-containing protein [Gloeothece verrucosa]|uniref:Gas vesicle protein n=1 Tax=Gloeothece verrucosa (strain PCC 7822) TaxID=497965 RepID=E0UCP6_GLOV7|nr:YtxH domain-containing protein [Gloeothece verrucosa]ADN15240.1 conserved hypothetical protein [Gloeothece verrucosa PCC 7822]